MIPHHIRLNHDALPDASGVYLMKAGDGSVLYVGKATSLARRVRQHFERPHSAFIEEMTRLVAEIDYLETPTVIEALILEANLIKYYWPKYNTLAKDNKSFLYLAITNEDFPKPLLVRGQDMDDHASQNYLAVFGPYTSPRALRAALDLVRNIFPWSTCAPGQKRPCFYVHLRKCPGVCINAIDTRTYRKTIHELIKFFEGKKDDLISQLRREMRGASKERRYEDAAALRNKIFSLEHIQDIAMLKREDVKREDDPIDTAKTGETAVHLFGRIEGYDISTISGTSTVAAMVVFENGAPAKQEYRKFRIKTVRGSNDVASLKETLMRRFRNHWRKPDVLLIDGGLPQVHVAEDVVRYLGLDIPVIGIAKGRDRKRNDLVCSRQTIEFCQRCEEYKNLLIAVRDEAHRFAITYHRVLRRRSLLPK